MRYLLLLLFAGDQEAFNAMGPDDAHAMFGQIGRWWSKHSEAERLSAASSSGHPIRRPRFVTATVTAMCSMVRSSRPRSTSADSPSSTWKRWTKPWNSLERGPRAAVSRCGGLWSAGSASGDR